MQSKVSKRVSQKWDGSSKASPSPQPSQTQVARLGLTLLQKAVGNRALLRILGAHTRSGSRSPDDLKGTDHANRYEQEADKASEELLRTGEAPEGSPPEKGNRSPSLSSRGSISGRPLSRGLRLFFERCFGQDFSDVRVHTDDRAERSAENLNARAYTRGNDVMFASGEYRPDTLEGRRLLGHELAHVVQQRGGSSQMRIPGSTVCLSRVQAGQVQPKLIARGDPAGFANLANSVIAVQKEIVVSPAGEVTLRATDVQGPPTLAAQELVSVLQTVINDSNTTSIQFSHGAPNVIVGSYGLSNIDLDDIAAFGGAAGRGLNAGTALSHELLEQYRKQVHLESYPTAHAAGLAAEARAAGAVITPGPLTQISATVTEIKDIYSFPDGTREEVTITLTSGNVTSVRRRPLP